MKLDAKNVSVSIAGKTIVRNLSIEVPDRKFSALLGANGSGKTTLLRSIYRTQKMDSGIVRLDDEDITHFSGKKLARNMAVMGQFNQINFDYTVLDIARWDGIRFTPCWSRKKSGIMRWLWRHWTR